MISCDCKKCQDCCWRSMGWFGSKEEIIHASKLMKCKTLKEFADKYLIKEYWPGKEHIDVPAPRKNPKRFKDKEKAKYWFEEVNKNQSFDTASWSHNLITGFACVFLDNNNKCKIHKSKPTECKTTYGCKAVNFKRTDLLKYWEKNQNWIVENLDKIRKSETWGL